MLNSHKITQTKPKLAVSSIPVRTAHMCVLMTVTIVVHSTALKSYDNLHSYPPDNHHSSDDVY